MSEEGESVKQSWHLEGAENGTNDSDGTDEDEDGAAAVADDDDDDDDWEDVDDDWVTDSGGDSDDEHEADFTHSDLAIADNCQCDMADNCPDILTGPQLIDFLRSLCLKANRCADVHTVGLVCMLCGHCLVMLDCFHFIAFCLLFLWLLPLVL